MTTPKFYIGFVLDNNNGIRYTHVTRHKLIAQMDAIVNMLSVAEECNLKDKVTAYVFDAEEDEVILGFTTNTVDEFLVEVKPEKYPDITKKALTLDLIMREMFSNIKDTDDDNEDDEDDPRIGAQVNIFTA